MGMQLRQVSPPGRQFIQGYRDDGFTVSGHRYEGAVLVTPDSVRDFLKANNVTAAGTSTDAKAAVVRVICVRK